jgi:two-component system cell cycle response regulator
MTARILVVDDLLPNVRLLEAKLESEYYDVTTAQSGKEALESIARNAPDVILLDVMMPEMDGFETCKIIKNDPRTAHIPVVMVTALSDVGDRVQGLNVGADDFLTKPINDLALFARIRSLVRLKSMTDELKLRDQTGQELGFDEVKKQRIQDTSGAKILIVDDDVSQGQQISQRLTSIGMEVYIEPIPKDAVRRSENIDFDLIIISTELSTDDGLHLCSHFRSQDKTRSTPLLILIEDNNMDLMVKGLDMGINDYLVTPIDSNEVVARVNIQVRRKRYQDALKATQKESLSMAIIDRLTHVYNRHYMDTHMQRMLHAAQKNNKPLSFMMVDVDHFKKVNDSYGHLSGDDVLRQVPERIMKNIRATDMTARYGGEEFAVILPDTSISHAADVAERIRKSIERDMFAIEVEPNQIKCTVSIGVSVSTPDDTVASLIARADKALYHVKNTGRNKVAVYYDAPKAGQ